MTFPGRFIRAATAGVFGALLLCGPAAAQEAGAAKWHIEKINKADDAYFKAAIAIETAGESPARLEALKRADDSYFEAVMAFETAQREAVQIAKVEAADDAYFKAAMELEKSREQSRALAELTSHRQMVARAEADDAITTAAVPGGAVAENLAKIKSADDAYFDAVIALETSGENPQDLKRLKDADDAYFAAVIALEEAYARQAEAKKAGKPVKVAAASAPVSDARAVHAARAAAPVYQPKPKVAGVTYRSSKMAGYTQRPTLRSDPLGLLYNMATYPVRVVVRRR